MFAVVYIKSYIDLLWKMCKGQGKRREEKWIEGWYAMTDIYQVQHWHDRFH